METAALPNTHDVTENGMAMEEDKRSKPFRRYICGEDSLRIAADEPYCLHRPMCRGRLNVSTHYSLQQVFQSSRTMGSILLICSSGSFFQLFWMPCRLSVVCSIFGNDCHMVFSPGEMVCCRNMHLPEPRYQLSSPVLNWVWEEHYRCHCWKHFALGWKIKSHCVAWPGM